MLSAEADDIPGRLNPLIVLLFAQDINYYSYMETCLPRSMFSWTGLHLSVANSGFEGMLNTPVIVQRAVVICWVVVLLFLLYFNAEWKVGYFFNVKRVKLLAIFSSFTKTTELTQPRPQSFSDAVPFFWRCAVLLTSFYRIFPNVYKIRSILVGYEELAGGFEPIRNGELFWMK